MKVLFVNACVRAEESRTLQLCRSALSEISQKYDVTEIVELNLDGENMLPFNRKRLAYRTKIVSENGLGDSLFRYARFFAEADLILVGAPYWDRSFPALLKIFFEHISVNGITFRYDEDGRELGMCAAERLLYITTSGGYIGDFNFGYDYVKGLCGLYGITRTDCLTAEGLDIIGVDVEAEVSQSMKRAKELIQGWNV